MVTKFSVDLSETRNNGRVTDSELTNSEVITQHGQSNESILVTANVEIGNRKNNLLLQTAVELVETTADVAGNSKCFANGSPIGKRKRENDDEINDGSISSAKKAKIADGEDKPTVHIKYGSLTRQSKQKLEELLQQWSEWHTQHCSPTDDSKEELEYGEGTYFPALHVGADKSSAVTFWMNKPLTSQHNKGFVAVDCKTVPSYDRSYSLEGDSKNLDAFRCFNCGSYSHSLNECPKPRDNVAINNARTQNQSNRSQKSSKSRTPTRYYQNSPGGKYDGLVPGVLQAETQRLLGIGELDPPPWLHRMREIGYPPGYLDPEDGDNQSSGITIFADEETEQETENNGKDIENENNEKTCPQPPYKMGVQFPGVNAPIPKNADDKKWATLPSSDLSRTVLPRPIYPPQPISINPHNNLMWHTNELVPPGGEPSLSFSPLYANHNSGNYNYSPSSPHFQSSPIAYGGSQYSTSPLSPYLLPRGPFSPINYGTFGYERRH